MPHRLDFDLVHWGAHDQRVGRMSTAETARAAGLIRQGLTIIQEEP
jgi:hypothetical protein